MKKFYAISELAPSTRPAGLAALLFGYVCCGCLGPSAPAIEGKYKGTWRGVLDDTITIDIEPCDFELELRYGDGSELGLEGSATMTLTCLQAASGVVLDKQIDASMSGVADYDGTLTIVAENCASVPCFASMYINGKVENEVLSGDLGFNLDTGGDFLSVDGRVSLKVQ